MPIVRSETAPTAPVYDAWGNIIRADWRPIPGRQGFWDISGETHRAGEGEVSANDSSFLTGYTGGQALLTQALADPSFRAGTRSYLAGARPGAQSVNAYNAALAAQGISPDELPYDSGQIKTARVQQQHGLPIASYLTPWLRALATGAGTNGAGTTTAAPQTSPAAPWRSFEGSGQSPAPTGVRTTPMGLEYLRSLALRTPRRAPYWDNDQLGRAV